MAEGESPASLEGEALPGGRKAPPDTRGGLALGILCRGTDELAEFPVPALHTGAQAKVWVSSSPPASRPGLILSSSLSPESQRRRRQGRGRRTARA